jgi:hypothetical protein
MKSRRIRLKKPVAVPAPPPEVEAPRLAPPRLSGVGFGAGDLSLSAAVRYRDGGTLRNPVIRGVDGVETGLPPQSSGGVQLHQPGGLTQETATEVYDRERVLWRSPCEVTTRNDRRHRTIEVRVHIPSRTLDLSIPDEAVYVMMMRTDRSDTDVTIALVREGIARELRAVEEHILQHIRRALRETRA